MCRDTGGMQPLQSKLLLEHGLWVQTHSGSHCACWREEGQEQAHMVEKEPACLSSQTTIYGKLL